MLSGVKFIPRDQLIQEKQNQDVDSSVKERKKSSNKKEKHRKKTKKFHTDSSDEEVTERIKKGSKRRKKWYSSDAASSLSLSQTESESSLDPDEKGRQKGKRSQSSKKRSKMSKTYYSSEVSLSSFVSESDDGEEFHQIGGRKHKRENKKRRGSRKVLNEKDILVDDRDFLPQDNQNLARKDIGLEWMLKPANKLERGSVQTDDPLEQPLDEEEVKKPNPRELNPYFKDNGHGYPEEESQTKVDGDQLMPPSVVGDGGASWRLKALKRAKEQAAREGKNLDEVVEERWGSLGQLAVSVASYTAAPAHAHLHAIKDRKRGATESSEAVADDRIKRGTKNLPGDKREYLRDVSFRPPEMREPKVHDSLSWRKKKSQNMSKEDTLLLSAATSSLNKFTNDGSFMHQVIRNQDKGIDGSVCSSHTKFEGEDVKTELVSSMTNSREECPVSKQALSANQLAAKVLQLRMKGKHEEAEKLMKEMETMDGMQETEANAIGHGSERSMSRYIGRDISIQQKRKSEDADMHLAQKIVQNKQYSLSGRADDEYDYDGVPSRKRNQKRGGVPDHKLPEKSDIVKRILTQQERCQFCFENPTRPRHLIVSIANFTYLMLPQWQPVVRGHCCILPMQHESSTRNVDNNVWEEIRNFKKCLLMMFAKQDMDVVFLETVMGLAQQRRHCLVECIPLPREIAKEAPLYFKKAIDEAEDEWSQHNAKKLIDTTVKGLRGSIPKDFPYFHVEFGLNKGFVHVIDDERQFKSSFGLNVIRGMLRLPEEDMHRRRKHDSVEVQKEAVSCFAREWEPFDWTRQLG